MLDENDPNIQIYEDVLQCCKENHLVIQIEMASRESAKPLNAVLKTYRNDSFSLSVFLDDPVKHDLSGDHWYSYKRRSPNFRLSCTFVYS